MIISENAVTVIKQFEGFRAKPYYDAKGVPTIGYGSTVYPNGKKVTMIDKPVSEPIAVQMMLYHLNNEVLPYLKKNVIVEINQNQIDALASLVYNIGAGNFVKSTLLKKINSHASILDIERAFKAWNKSGNKVLNGLVNRRNQEYNLFIKK